MEIGAVNTGTLTNKLYAGKSAKKQTDNFGYLQNEEGNTEKSASLSRANTDIDTIYQKLKYQSSREHHYLTSNSCNLISQSSGNFSRVENDRYVIEQSDSIAGYWDIYDKELDNHIIINPNGANVQTNEATGKNYLIAEEPGYGFCFAEELPDGLMNTLQEFMHTDSIQIGSLNPSYIIQTDSTTGIDTFTVSGQEGFYGKMMITDKEQLEKLRDLAAVYRQNYPNLATSDEMALNFARGEVLGFNSRTQNGILMTNQTGIIYMDNDNSTRDWSVSYSQSADTYRKIKNAIGENLLTDIESFDDWKEWFEDNSLAYEKVLTDEELAKLLS